MSNKQITNTHLYRIINGCNTLNPIKCVNAGTKFSNSNSVISIQILKNNYYQHVRELLDYTEHNVRVFKDRNIIDWEGYLIYEEDDYETKINSCKSLNKLIRCTAKTLVDLNQSVNNIEYDNNQISTVKFVIDKFINVLANYVMPIINKAYVPNVSGNNLYSNVSDNIQPHLLTYVVYQNDIRDLIISRYFDGWSDRVFELFIGHFSFCRSTLNKVFEYIIHFIENTRDKKNQQIYDTRLNVLSDTEFNHKISYYQSLLDRVLELVIIELQSVRQRYKNIRTKRKARRLRRRNRRNRRNRLII